MAEAPIFCSATDNVSCTLRIESGTIKKRTMSKRTPSSTRATEGTADLSLSLKGQVTLQRLGDAVEAWTDFLQEVAQDVTGSTSKTAVRYVVTKAKGGSFTLGVRPQAAREGVPVSVLPRISRTVTSGIRKLNRQAIKPKHFNDKALLKLRDLARLASPEIPSLQVSNGVGKPIPLSARMLAHVESVLAPEVHSIGTIEGELEGLIIHGNKRFLIYDQLTGHQVICHFGELVRWEGLRDAMGRRVAVTGGIRSRRSGERVSIRVASYYVFPREDELPTADDVRGLLRTAQ